MAVIVHANEAVDNALKRLHREVLREKILDTFRDRVYFTPKNAAKAEKKREYAKMKRRRRKAARRVS